jgi:hypothetical protein
VQSSGYPLWHQDFPADGAHQPFPAFASRDSGAEFSQEGRELRVVRRAAGRRGTEPGDRLPELLTFLRDMSKDDVQLIVVEPAG